jgi:hypothetical protein
MDKDKIHKTKENIKVSNLDDKTRKQLFEKFVEKGGRVVDDKEKRKNLIISRQQQKKLSKRLNESRKKTKSQIIQQIAVKDTAIKPIQSSSSIKNEPMTAFEKLVLRLKLKFGGISDLAAYHFSSGFFKKFNSHYKLSMMEIQIAYLELYKKNIEAGKKIKDRIDSLKPLYNELIEESGNLYDKITIDQIIDGYSSFPDIPVRINDLKEPILRLYRSIHILYPYETMILNSYNTAIDIYSKVAKEHDVSAFSLRKRVRSGIFVVFHKLYPKLHLLFCHYNGIIAEIGGRQVNSLLSISQDDRPGKRAKRSEEQDIEKELQFLKEKSIEEEDKKSEEKILDSFENKAIRFGLNLMSKLDIKSLRESYDKNRLFENVSDSNTILLTYLLFNEFDKEYSFILTTSKVHFAVDFSDKTKLDFKTKLNNLYDEMRSCMETFRKYSDDLFSYEKARMEKPSGPAQYIEYTKRIEIQKKKMSDSGKNAISTVYRYLETINSEIALLIQDMDGAQKFILNPQDTLEFEQAIEGDKKVNGMKVYQAYYTVYAYISAFIYRLTSGDLSNLTHFDNLVVLDNDIKNRHKQDQNTDETIKTVMQELDDLL